jgi:hypothetical protein
MSLLSRLECVDMEEVGVTMTERAKNSPGWAVELRGEKIDLDVFRDMLIPGFDPFSEDFVEGDSTLLLLRCGSWSQLDDVSSVMLDATHRVTMLNGAALVFHSDAEPITLGGILKFNPDGTRVPNVTITGSGYARLRGSRLRARGSTGGPPSPPSESAMQEQLRRANTDPIRAELLNQLARANDWYELFKVMELAERLIRSAGGREAFLGKDYEKWMRVRYTANYPRHARVDEGPAQPLTEWYESRQFVVEHVARLLLNL